MPLKSIYDSLTLRNGCVAVDEINSVQSKLRARQFDEAVLHLTIFDKDQAALAFRLDALQDIEGSQNAGRRRDEILILRQRIDGGMHRDSPDMMEHFQGCSYFKPPWASFKRASS